MTDFVREITLYILDGLLNIGTLIMTICKWAVIGAAWAAMAGAALAVLYFAWPFILVATLFWFVVFPMIDKAS